MKSKKLLLIVLCSILVLSLFIERINAQTRQDWRRPFKPFPDQITPEEIEKLRVALQNYMYGRTIISAINISLLCYLLYIYVDIYRVNRSNFAFGLVFLSIALLLYSITSNPYLNYVLGFNGFRITRVFNFIPDIFTTVASFILIYLSRQ